MSHSLWGEEETARINIQGRSVLDVFQEHEGEQYCDTSVDKGMRQVVIGLVYRFLHEQCMCKAFMEKKSKTFKYTQKKN